MATTENELAERIAKTRRDLGYTQEQLAAKICISRGAIAQWEGGQVKNLKMVHLLKLAALGHKNLNWLALGEGPEDADEQPIDLSIVREAIITMTTLLGALQKTIDPEKLANLVGFYYQLRITDPEMPTEKIKKLILSAV